jgi:hypothetical protein
MRNLCRILILLIAVTTSLSLSAQATRTWVSGVGDDVNPCSRTAPCKTFAGAISKTAAGGEINAIDPGGFGAVTITKSITINGAGTLASILSSGVSGVIINAASTDKIFLRDIHINGNSNGTTVHGVRIISAGSVVIENCLISNIGNATSSHGIVLQNSTTTEVNVVNTTIRNIAGHGIFTNTGAGFQSRLVLDGVNVIDAAQNGVTLNANTLAVISNSSFTQNTNAGLGVSAASCEAHVYDTVLSRNGFGVHVGASGGGVIRLYGSQITQNTVDGVKILAGTVVSHGNNAITGNAGVQTVSSAIGTQ